MKFFVEITEREGTTELSPHRFAAVANLLLDDDCYGGFYIDYGRTAQDAFEHVKSLILEDYGPAMEVVEGKLDIYSLREPEEIDYTKA